MELNEIWVIMSEEPPRYFGQEAEPDLLEWWFASEEEAREFCNRTDEGKAAYAEYASGHEQAQRRLAEDYAEKMATYELLTAHGHPWMIPRRPFAVSLVPFEKWRKLNCPTLTPIKLKRFEVR